MNTTRQKIDWIAKWIWSPGRMRRPFHCSYFRKTFDVKGTSRRAMIHCAADSKYRLWVNGKYIGFGPARGHSKHPYYDTHVVMLSAGQNTLAFLVQHYTDRCAIFSSVRGGLICQVEVGGEVVEATENSWRTLSAEAYKGITGMIFPEYFNL